MTYDEIMFRCENEPIYFLGLCCFVSFVFALNLTGGYALCQLILSGLRSLFRALKAHFQKNKKD